MRTFLFPFLVLVCCASCKEDSQFNKLQASLKDQLLVGHIYDAKQAGISFDQVEDHVQTTATINTAREQYPEGLNRVAWDLDKDEVSEISSIQELLIQPNRQPVVVYWVRPVEARNPKIVGLVWINNQPPKIFCAVVYPP